MSYLSLINKENIIIIRYSGYLTFFSYKSPRKQGLMIRMYLGSQICVERLKRQLSRCVVVSDAGTEAATCASLCSSTASIGIWSLDQCPVPLTVRPEECCWACWETDGWLVAPQMWTTSAPTLHPVLRIKGHLVYTRLLRSRREWGVIIYDLRDHNPVLIRWIEHHFFS